MSPSKVQGVPECLGSCCIIHGDWKRAEELERLLSFIVCLAFATLTHKKGIGDFERQSVGTTGFAVTIESSTDCG